MPSIDVDKNGTQLTYLDSGAPESLDYITIFTVHGINFTAGTPYSSFYILHSIEYFKGIFQRVISIAPSFNLRIVAINRRNYGGSTAFSKEEMSQLRGGTFEQRTSFCVDRGVEIMTFIDKFVNKYNIPPLSSDRRSGGFALLGWSLGSQITCAAISHVDKLSEECQNRLGSRLRALVLHGTSSKHSFISVPHLNHIFKNSIEPPTVSLGLPLPSKIWLPYIDSSIPADSKVPFFTQWITSYWDHGDLSSRTLDTLSYIVPSSNFNKACFNHTIKRILPNMKISLITGDRTAAIMFAPYFALLDEEESRGENIINFKVLKGANHFVSRLTA